MFRSNSLTRYNAYLKSTKKLKNIQFIKEINKDTLELCRGYNGNNKFLRLLHSSKNNDLPSELQKTLKQNDLINVFKNKYVVVVQNYLNENNEKLKKKYNNISINPFKDNGLSKISNRFLFGSAAVAAGTTESIEDILKISSSSQAKPESVSSETVNVTPAEAVPQAETEIIPEPPALPDLSELLNQTNALGEPTFASLGLGGWTPVGLIERCFEYMHVTFDLPWWSVIVMGTIVIRLAMFPLVVMSQRNGAKMANNLPQMQEIQAKMSEARLTGNAIEVARYSQELMQFMSKKGINPLKNMIVPLAQAPVFLSFFWSLKDMANLPVESLQTGGLWWFTDLTVPDQFYLLPVLTSLTLWATIEMGTDSAKLSSQNMFLMKYVLRALPIIIFPFTLNFPGAVLCYWFSSNTISLLQVGLLKIPAVRDYFKIEKLVPYNPETLPIKQKGFTEGIKESWANIKITKELEERTKLDEIQFQRAGKGPITKTYKYDPTKTPISAKKR